VVAWSRIWLHARYEDVLWSAKGRIVCARCSWAGSEEATTAIPAIRFFVVLLWWWRPRCLRMRAMISVMILGRVMMVAALLRFVQGTILVPGPDAISVIVEIRLAGFHTVRWRQTTTWRPVSGWSSQRLPLKLVMQCMQGQVADAGSKPSEFLKIELSRCAPSSAEHLVLIHHA